MMKLSKILLSSIVLIFLCLIFNQYSLNRTFLVENNSQNCLIEHLQTTRVGTQVVKFWLAPQQIQTIEIKRHYSRKSISNLSNYIGIHIRKGDNCALFPILSSRC